MKLLVVNADDFGRSAAVNAGIIESHEKGIVTSASVMTDRDAFAEAVALARRYPHLGIGLHLDLDRFFDVQHGSGRLLRYQDATLPMTAIAHETERQIRKAQDAGLSLTHLDGHHHAHLRPELIATVAALAAKFKIPVVRYFSGFYEGLYPGLSAQWVPDLLRRFGLTFTQTFFAGWEAVESSLPGYRYWNPAEPFETAELMVHPGQGEAWRERETALCTAPEIKAQLQAQGITLGTFRELKAVPA